VEHGQVWFLKSLLQEALWRSRYGEAQSGLGWRRVGGRKSSRSVKVEQGPTLIESVMMVSRKDGHDDDEDGDDEMITGLNSLFLKERR